MFSHWLTHTEHVDGSNNARPAEEAATPVNGRVKPADGDSGESRGDGAASAASRVGGSHSKTAPEEIV